MNTTTSRCISALFVTAALAGCQMIPLQNRAATTTVPQAPLSASDAWNKLMDMDRDSVSHGLLPPEVITYDLQIAQMIPEGEQLRDSHDKVKGPVWLKKFNATMAARSAVIEKVTARQMARINAMPGAGQAPDPCLSPMGRNICTTPPAQSGAVQYSVGPGGIGASVGGLFVGPGGIGAQ